MGNCDICIFTNLPNFSGCNQAIKVNVNVIVILLFVICLIQGYKILIVSWTGYGNLSFFVLNRVRVSEPKRNTPTQLWVGYPPTHPPLGIHPKRRIIQIGILNWFWIVRSIWSVDLSIAFLIVWLHELLTKSRRCFSEGIQETPDVRRLCSQANFHKDCPCFPHQVTFSTCHPSSVLFGVRLKTHACLSCSVVMVSWIQGSLFSNWLN